MSPFLVYRKKASVSYTIPESKRQTQTVTNQGSEQMQKQSRSYQETGSWSPPNHRLPVPPGIHFTMYLELPCRNLGTTRVEAGNSRLSTRLLDTSLLSYHQPIRRQSHTLQSSPQILLIKKNTFLKTISEFGFFEHEPTVLLAWPCNKPFSFINSNISILVSLASLWVGNSFKSCDRVSETNLVLSVYNECLHAPNRFLAGWGTGKPLSLGPMTSVSSRSLASSRTLMPNMPAETTPRGKGRGQWRASFLPKLYLQLG